MPGAIHGEKVDVAPVIHQRGIAAVFRCQLKILLGHGRSLIFLGKSQVSIGIIFTSQFPPLALLLGGSIVMPGRLLDGWQHFCRLSLLDSSKKLYAALSINLLHALLFGRLAGSSRSFIALDLVDVVLVVDVP